MSVMTEPKGVVLVVACDLSQNCLGNQDYEGTLLVTMPLELKFE